MQYALQVVLQTVVADVSSIDPEHTCIVDCEKLQSNGTSVNWIAHEELLFIHKHAVVC